MRKYAPIKFLIAGMIALLSFGSAGIPAAYAAIDFTSPTLVSMSQSNGPDAGGNQITVTGTNFNNVDGIMVNFGTASTVIDAGSVSTDVSGVSSAVLFVPEQINATTVSVSVTNLVGQDPGATSNSLTYTYYSSYPGFIQDIYTGPADATNVVLTADANCATFAPFHECAFISTSIVSVTDAVTNAAIDGATYTVDSAQQITVSLPARTLASNSIPETVNITVSNPSTLDSYSDLGYTYYALPILAFTPSTYTASQGRAITPIDMVNTGGPCDGLITQTAGSLPTGLAMDANTGQITGTANTVASAVSFTASCTNAAGTASASVSIAVAPTTQTIDFTLSTTGTAPNYTATYNDAPIVYSAVSSASLPVTVTSSDTSIATVSGGHINIVGAGVVTLTATQAGNADFGAATPVAVTLDIAGTAQTLTLSGISTAATYGDPQMSYSVTGAQTPVTVTSSNTAVATIDAVNGKVTIVGGGQTTITATAIAQNGYYAATSNAITLTVAKLDQSISLTGVANNASFVWHAPAVQILHNVSSGLTPVTYSSSDSTKVNVTSTGLLTFVGTGSAVITATQAGNAGYNPTSTSVTLNVTAGTQTISFSGLNPDTLGGSIKTVLFGVSPLPFTATSDSGLTVSVASSNTGVASISGNTVIVNGVGTATITASQAGDPSGMAAATPVSMTLVVTQGTQTISLTGVPSPSVAYSDGPITFSASSSSSLPVTVTSSNTAIATISGSQINLVGIGSVTITANQAGNANFAAAAPVSVTFEVVKGSQAISFNPNSTLILGGASMTLTSILTPIDVVTPISVVYSVSTPATCSISGRILTPIALGACTVTASAPANSHMNAATDVVRTVNVVASAAQNVTIQGLPTSVVYGSSDVAFVVQNVLNLDMSVTSPSSSVVTLTKADPLFSTDWIMHVVGVGSTVISASDGQGGLRTQTVTVTAKPITVTGITAALDTNGHVVFSGGVLSGLLPADQSLVTVDYTNANATYINGVLKIGGTFGLAGARSANYSLLQPTVFTVSVSVSSITPATGSTDGGTEVTILGSGFTAGARVTFGGVEATRVTFNNPGSLTVITPQHIPGSVPVVVSLPGFTAFELTSGFLYQDYLPEISGVTQPVGKVAGGGTIVISGRNFTKGATVTIGGNKATITAVTPSAITILVPAHDAGPVKIVVANPGFDPVIWTGEFLYLEPISVSVPSLIKVWSTGGKRVSISGSNFVAGLTVKVNGVLAKDIQLSGTSSLSFVMPSGVSGRGDILITAVDGTTVSLPAAVQFLKAPELKVTFSGKSNKLSASGLKAIKSYAKRLKTANASLTVSNVNVTGYATGAQPAFTSLKLAVSRASSIQVALKAALKALGLKTKVLVGSVGQTDAASNFVTIAPR